MTRRGRCGLALTLGALVGEVLGLAILGPRPELPPIVARSRSATIAAPIVEERVAREEPPAPAPAPARHEDQVAREAPSTWIVQLRVGVDSAEVLDARHKPTLRFRPDALPASGPFEVRARDAQGRTWSGRLDPQGLAPAEVPAGLRRADGAWVRGDEVWMPTVPVLVKLPGSLTAPVQLEVRGHDGRLLGAGRVG